MIKSNRAASADGLEGDFTPKSRKASVFGSLERMFNMLTPKKQSKSTCDGPRKVKVCVSLKMFIILNQFVF